MIEKIKHLRTTVSGRVPTSAQIEEGELAINLADKKLYTKDHNGDVVTVGSDLETTDARYAKKTDVYTKSETDDKDAGRVSKGGDTMTGELRTTGFDYVIRRPVTEGGWARGVIAQNSEGTARLGGAGWLGTGADNSVTHYAIGFGSDSWWETGSTAKFYPSGSASIKNTLEVGQNLAFKGTQRQHLVWYAPDGAAKAYIWKDPDTDYLTHTATSRFEKGIGRTSHTSGYLEGSYNNVGDNAAKTNPIYIIGSSYKPSDTELGNMYGIGYAYNNSCTYLSSLKNGGHGWGLYVASDGDARVFLNASRGDIEITGGIQSTNRGNSWISQKDATNVPVQMTISDSSYGAAVRWRSSSRTCTVGSLGNSQWGFFGYNNSQTANGTNWSAYIDHNGTWYASGGLGTSGDLNVHGNEIYLRGGSPTMWFVDSDQRSCCWHNNSNLMYLLRGKGNGATSWDSGPHNRHPVTFNLTDGSATFSGNVAAYSDERLKENINVVPDALEKVSKLRGVTYEWKHKEEGVGEQAGVIAQDVQKVLPQAVTEMPNGDLTVAYSQLSALFVEAIKELKEQNEYLLKTVEELKNGL